MTLTTILEHILKNFGEDGKQTVRTLLEQEDYQKNTPIVLAAQQDIQHACLEALCNSWFAVHQDASLPVDVIIEAIKVGAIKVGAIKEEAIKEEAEKNVL